jgi:hypothetical protein
MKILPTLLVLSAVAFSQALGSNNYDAPQATVAPVIDGTMDSPWSMAPWDSINHTWLGGTVPNAADFSGRYKILWDSNRIYLLIEVTDDSLSDDHPDPLDNYWNDDCIEIFVDENHNGGDHQANYSAFAYHVSTTFDVVDYGDDNQAHLFNDHITTARKKSGNTYLWEMSLKVFGENYSFAGPNSPLSLAMGKILGFTLAYCDNDAGDTRESFIGSVDTQGHIDNLGYQDASVFGTLHLVLNPSGLAPTQSMRSQTPVEKQRFSANGAWLSPWEKSWNGVGLEPITK